jgi:tetratricopeptide (TPR) repeat protein
MGNSALGSNLDCLIDHVVGLLQGRKNLELSCRTPLSLDDEQEQLKAVFEITQASHSYRDSGDYWLAAAHLIENVKYYQSTGDLGKCGCALLEVADCLFSSGESEIATECCEEAIPLIIRSGNHYSWARRMASIGELLLVAIALNSGGAHEAFAALRRARSRLTSKEVRTLLNEDAHRVSRKLIIAYRTGTREPLQELERIPPRRKRTEEKNLLVLLDEWRSQYGAIGMSIERLSLEKAKLDRSLHRE